MDSAPSLPYTHRFQIGAFRCQVHDGGGSRPDLNSPTGFAFSAIGLESAARLGYMARHDEVATGRSTGESNRALLTRCIGGMGNCLNGVVSGLVLSLLTDRAFFVEWNYPVSSCGINWDFGSAAASVRAALNAAPRQEFVDDCFVATELTRWLERCTISELQAHWPQPHIKIDTNCPLYKHLAMNPNLAPNLQALGLLRKPSFPLELKQSNAAVAMTPNDPYHPYSPGFLAYGAALRSFFGIAPDLYAEVIKLIDAIPRGALLIGIQIRLGGAVNGKPNDPVFLPDGMIEDVLRCAQTLGGLLQLSYQHSAKTMTGAPLAFFLASDSERVTESARKRFGSRLVVSAGVPMHGHAGQGLPKALIDEWMLVLSDALVVTPGSTFGATAAMLNGRLPYYVSWGDKKCRVTDMAAPPPRYQTIFPAF